MSKVEATTAEEKIQRNEAIVRAWADDADSEYERAVLLSMLRCSKNPNQREHRGRMSAEVAHGWASAERDAALVLTNRTAAELCAKTADTLTAVASKLYPLSD